MLLRMQALHVPLRVYGSFGWQHLTGLPCVRASSDLDLLAPVPNLECASTVARALEALCLSCRVDGELVFPGGRAVAWREFLQLAGGAVDRVLVKERHQVQLLGLAELGRLPGPGWNGVPAMAQLLPNVTLPAAVRAPVALAV
jgi:phosphoribosyl-dephospho-CoA transferase